MIGETNKIIFGGLLVLMGVCFGVKDLDAGVQMMGDDIHDFRPLLLIVMGETNME